MKILCLAPFGPEAATLYARILPMLHALPSECKVTVVFPEMYTKYRHRFILPFEDKLKFIFTGRSDEPKRLTFNNKYSRMTSELRGILREFSLYTIGRFCPPFTGISNLNSFVFNLTNILDLEDDFDFIYVSKPWFHSAGTGLWLSWKWNIPIYLDLDDLDIHSKSLILRRFDGIVVASRELANKLKLYNPCYIPNTVNLNMFNPGKYRKSIAKKDKLTFVYSGIMFRYLKLEMILKAFRLMQVDTSLIFVGEGERKPILENAARALKLQNRVIFKGWVDYASMPGLLSSCDVALIYLQNSDFEKCKSPIKLYEYMALELPILATDIGEVGYTVNNAKCGILVKHEDVRGMAGAMNRLVSDDKFRKELGRNGRNYLMQKQNWKILSSKLYSFITKNVNAGLKNS